MGWRVLPPREYASHDPALQVYASYRYRRDFAETAKAGGRLAALLQPLLREAALQGAVEGPAEGGAQGALPLDPPTMRQAIAWELALHAIHQREVRPGAWRAGWGGAGLGGGAAGRGCTQGSKAQRPVWGRSPSQQAPPPLQVCCLPTFRRRQANPPVLPWPQVAAAEAALGEEAGAQLVRDVHVRITPLSRRACLVYAPAYVFDYIYGGWVRGWVERSGGAGGWAALTTLAHLPC